MKRYDACIAAFVAGKPIAPDASLPEVMKSLLASLTVLVNLPFARELWLKNPAHLVSQVSEPMLVVIGKKDIQIDWRADGGPLQTATATDGNATFVFPDNTDHVLKREPRPQDELLAAEVSARYNAEGRVLDSDALSVITNWLVERSDEAR
jgi:hypothetical protein